MNSLPKNVKSAATILAAVLFSFLSKNPVFGQKTIETSPASQKPWSFLPKIAPGKPHNWAFCWGYNRARFAPSDLRFHGPDYDFTVHDLEAKDRPSKFSFERYFGLQSITIPQYNWRLGRKIAGRWWASIGQDHLKYVAVQGQQTTVSGEISTAASAKFAGQYANQPLALTTDFLRFEHTDGLSLMSVEVEYRLPVVRFGQFSLNWSGGLGGGWAVCRTDVALFDERVDTKFHVSGRSVQAKTSVELDWKNRLFLAWGWRGGRANLPDILVKDKKSPIRAGQKIGFLERSGVLGVRF